MVFADQGYTGEEPARAALDEGIELQVIKLPKAKKGFAVAAPLGGRMQLRLA